MKKEFRSGCPIISALDVAGYKWSLLIIRDMRLKRKKPSKKYLIMNKHLLNVPTSQSEVVGRRGVEWQVLLIVPELFLLIFPIFFSKLHQSFALKLFYCCCNLLILSILYEFLSFNQNALRVIIGPFRHN